jgi:hypothetical protein
LWAEREEEMKEWIQMLRKAVEYFKKNGTTDSLSFGTGLFILVSFTKK